MADGDALRSRRKRLHAAGDHSLCKRCSAVLGGAAMVEAQEIPADDIGKMRWLADQLARAYRAEPGNAMLAQQLRMTLQALAGSGKPSDDDLESLFAELSSS